MKNQILLIHGGSTYDSYDSYIESLKKKNPKLEWIQSRKDWKNSLQEYLGTDYVVYTPQMPNKTNAQYGEWKIWFEKIIDLLSDDFILIGYSLGGIFAVKYLSENKISKRIKRMMLLGTPYDNEGMEKEPLYSFLRKGNLSDFRNQAHELYFYHSRDDFAVPFAHIEKYEQEIPDAVFRKFEDKNHFIIEKIDELLEDIKN